MNTYEEKQEARKARFEELAMNARREADALARQSSDMLKGIPFGQPIMGERDRRFRNRAGAKMDKAMEASKKAEYYEQKAESVGKGGISGLDPEAITKLEKQLEQLTAHQEQMKAANKAIRMKNQEKGNLKLKELGYSDKEIEALRTPNFLGRLGYPNYELTNNNANIRRIKQRIEELKELSEMKVETETNSLYEFFMDDGRLQFSFDGKPSGEIRDILKSYGFKWSPSRSFRQGADTMKKYAKVGDRISITGTMQWQDWNKNNFKKDVLKIIVDRFELCGKAENEIAPEKEQENTLDNLPFPKDFSPKVTF